MRERAYNALAMPPGYKAKRMSHDVFSNKVLIILVPESLRHS